MLIIRLFLAGIFGVAALGKFLDLEGSEKAVGAFGVPKSLAKPISFLLPLFELAIAISLLFVEISWFASIAGVLLLLLFIVGMLIQISKGNAPDCHCFGQIHSEPVSKKSVIRNAIIAVIGFLLVVSGRETQGIDLFKKDLQSVGSADYMQFVLGLAIVMLLAAIIYFLKQISEQQSKILRRIEILEILSSGERSIEHDNIGHPDDGLPIGAPVPDFQLVSVSGRKVQFNHLISRGKSLVLLFVSPNCNPCSAMLPEIKKWQSKFGEKLDFVLISTGNAKENTEKFGEVTKDILLQKEKEIGEFFGALWTPTALIINSDGTVGSRTAAGDEAIRELIEKVKSKINGSENIFISSNESGLRKVKIGESVPEFEHTDVYGKAIGTKDLKGKKTLIAFWSETCPHCVAMLDDLREWEKIKGQDEPDLLLFSSGDAETHKKFDLKSPIILDDEHKTAEKLGMSGTPSAVLINENGKFISETALGAFEIWALLGKRK